MLTRPCFIWRITTHPGPHETTWSKELWKMHDSTQQLKINTAGLQVLGRCSESQVRSVFSLPDRCSLFSSGCAGYWPGDALSVTGHWKSWPDIPVRRWYEAAASAQADQSIICEWLCVLMTTRSYNYPAGSTRRSSILNFTQHWWPFFGHDCASLIHESLRLFYMEGRSNLI